MDEQNKKPDPLTDKAFSRLALMSILGILICIVCLCSTTWAWFTDSIPSKGNSIKVADECLLSVTVTDENGTALEDLEAGVQLEQGKTYIVTLSLPRDSASGYCLIKASGQSYYTDYIVRHENDEAQTVSFALTVAESQTVEFEPRWGIYAKESDVIDGQLSIPSL